jgi:hypothetical protein
MIYPWCVIGDVQAYNQQRPTYGAATKPTNTQVNEFIDRIASRLRGLISSYGYDVDNIHAVSSTVAGAITAGSDVALTVADGTGFTENSKILIVGLTSGVRTWEYDIIKTVSGTTVTITTIDNNYDAASVTVYQINDAMEIVRDLNALGAAAMAEEAVFMGASPNRSDHAEKLWERFYGSEETQYGLWAIENIPDFLYGATQTDQAISERPATSYQVENSDDDYVDQGPTFPMLGNVW